MVKRQLVGGEVHRVRDDLTQGVLGLRGNFT
jgi:hypothetical protein